MNRRDNSLEKSTRFILSAYMALENEGFLENKTLQPIADLFPGGPYRSIIMRDLLDVELLRKVLEKMCTQMEESE